MADLDATGVQSAVHRPAGHLHSKLRITQEHRLVFGRSLHKPAHHPDIYNLTMMWLEWEIC